MDLIILLLFCLNPDIQHQELTNSLNRQDHSGFVAMLFKKTSLDAEIGQTRKSLSYLALNGDSCMLSGVSAICVPPVDVGGVVTSLLNQQG